jgi:hypothetical protein
MECDEAHFLQRFVEMLCCLFGYIKMRSTVKTVSANTVFRIKLIGQGIVE